MSMYRCAACGSPKVVQDVQTGGIQFNYLKGAIGDVVLGPGGAVAGIENGQTIVYKCPDCGITLTYPMPSNIKTAIDMGVQSFDARKDLFVDGFLFSWDALKWQFKNIEDSPADHELERRSASSAKALSFFATTIKEDFDEAIDHVRDFWTKHGYYDKSGNGTKTKIRFSKETPPTLTDYLDYVSASRLIVENMSKFLPPPVPKEYRGLKAYDFTGLFMSYMLDELRKFELEKFENNDDSYRFATNSKSILTDFFDNNPFFIDFIRFYNNSDVIYIRQFGMLAGDPIDNLTNSNAPRTFHINNFMMTNSYSFDYYHEKLKENTFYNGSPNATVYLPRYIVKDGQLGWMPSYRSSIESNYIELIQKFLSAHPEVKEKFYADIEIHKADIEQKTILERHRNEDSAAKGDIEKIKDEISQHRVQISALERKIFGKAKAREEIERRKVDIERLEKQKAEKQQLIDIHNDFRRSYKEAADGGIYYDVLLAKYSYLLDWEWIDPSIQPAKEPVEEISPRSDAEKNISFQPMLASSASEIREFKQLLDDGIITQEEFDTKKKQLLGL